ncbi:MAG: hypothetical protein HY719_02485 [Planctomycetes bacterium]|nr:hypothetical protein [Planctomycetota bacterium]
MRALLYVVSVALLAAVGGGGAFYVLNPSYFALPVDAEPEPVRPQVLKPEDPIAEYTDFIKGLMDLRVVKVAPVAAPTVSGTIPDITPPPPAPDKAQQLLQELKDLVPVLHVFVSSVPENSAITVEQTTKEKQKIHCVYRPGDWLFEDDKGLPVDGEILDVGWNFFTVRYKGLTLTYDFKPAEPFAPADFAGLELRDEAAAALIGAGAAAGTGAEASAQSAAGAPQPGASAGEPPLPAGTPPIPVEWDGKTRQLDPEGNHWLFAQTEVDQMNEETLVNALSVDSSYNEAEKRYDGLKVMRIPEGHVARRVGFGEGDVLKSINGRPVSNMKEAQTVAREERNAGRTTFVVVFTRKGVQQTKTFRIK